MESYEEALKHKPDHSEAWAAKNRVLDKLQKWLDERRPPSLFVKIYEQMAATEAQLHLFVGQRLKQVLGESEAEWWVKGVPLPVKKKCSDRRNEDPRWRPLYSYTDLIDLQGILDKNWGCFQDDFQRVKGSVKSKKEFLDNLARLNEIRKIDVHPIRDVLTEDELKFARRMREVIQDFVGR